ncbi:MAG: nicotinate phosphoribosyltransferase [Deltaproteobacteria bacterium]|nr:nicotinate phosphoribosyltransferase [Deltaproteobacteria bacterium]
MPYSALLTDLYELTMLAGYLREDMHEQQAAFDLFFREPPYLGSYAVFAGLAPALDYLSHLKFSDADLAYLNSLNLFDAPFLEFLKTFRFRGRVTAPCEGEVVFAGEPLLTVEGTLAETQFVETALLNIINFQTLVATKAARLKIAAGPDSEVIEFGLRRAQGPDGGLSVARAAAIGGVLSTSNVQAGQVFGLPVKGTHAHSWVMAFPDELTAFRAYAECFPDSCVLLVDTYDTLTSGLPHALMVAGELRELGHEMLGVRLDSGDLAYLSREARKRFDRAGFENVKIVASNELDEHVIHSIRSEGGCIDIYGVGTRLATCAGPEGGALGGVYKLVESNGKPRLKTTSDPAKSTLPSRKRWLRAVNPDGQFHMDVLDLQDHSGEPFRPGHIAFDPANPQRHKMVPLQCDLIDCRHVVMDSGEVLSQAPSLEALASYAAAQLSRLPEGTLRLINPHRYKVGVSRRLLELRNRLQTAATS